jgi:sensor histidine kinase YesM
MASPDISRAVNPLRRILMHLLFWLVYIAVSLFTELYLSSSFQQHPGWVWVEKALLMQMLLLIPKLGAVYYLVYFLLPRWLKGGNKALQILEVILVFVLLIAMYRFIIQVIGWRMVYHEVPDATTGLSFVARIFYSLLDILEVAGVATAIKLFRLRIAAVKREKELVQEKLRSELLHLKAQLNPHFLFNSLNSIFALSRQQSTQTPEAVMKLSQILRYVLYEAEKKLSSLGSEMKIIDDYVELQQLRFGGRVQIVRKTEVENASAPLAPLLILPLVENAFKHGVGPVGEESEILISIIQKKEILKVKVRNAIWRESIPSRENEGIGLANVQRQVELLYRIHSLDYQEAGGFFTVDLQLDTSSYAGTELLDR